MFTYSHFITSGFVGDRIRRRRPMQFPSFLAGSVLPDLPLIGWTFWYFEYRRSLGPVSGNPFGALYDDFFFRDPLWILTHNFFHAPLLIAAFVWIGYRVARSRSRLGFGLMWFWLGCGLHAAVDIVTHHNDGPLVLFPFDWQWRFLGPVSYWHPGYYGREMWLLEGALDLVVIGYFAVLALKAKSRVGVGPQ